MNSNNNYTIRSCAIRGCLSRGDANRFERCTSYLCLFVSLTLVDYVATRITSMYIRIEYVGPATCITHMPWNIYEPDPLTRAWANYVRLPRAPSLSRGPRNSRRERSYNYCSRFATLENAIICPLTIVVRISTDRGAEADLEKVGWWLLPKINKEARREELIRLDGRVWFETHVPRNEWGDPLPHKEFSFDSGKRFITS